MRFTRAVDVAAPVEVLWAFHERPDILQLLSAPGERVTVLVPPRSLAAGTRVKLRVWLGPLPMTIEAEHVACEPRRSFTDRMVRGPFRSWRHEHRFEETPSGSRLVDDIEYELPGGWLGRALGGRLVERRLERLFAYRHRVTRAACEAQVKTGS